MDGSVKNLLQAEKLAQSIITVAQEERKMKQENARSTAQTMINVVEQDLRRKFEAREEQVSS